MSTKPLDSVRRQGDRLRQLRAFCQAARLKSFTRAAAYLLSSQPSVSEQIRLLEAELDVTLFDRGGPPLSLTPSGRRLYQHVFPLVVSMDRLPDTFADLHHGIDSGELQVAAGQTTASLVLPEYLKRFQAQRPGLRIQVRIGTGGERLTWLRAYEVDVVLGAMGAGQDDLEFRPLFSAEHILITPEDHPLAKRASVTLSELFSWPKLGHPAGTHIRMMADLIAQRHQLVNSVEVEIGGWTTLKQYVEAGLGIALYPCFGVTGRDRVSVVALRPSGPKPSYGLYTRPDRPPSRAAERLIRIIDPPSSAPPGASRT